LETDSPESRLFYDAMSRGPLTTEERAQESDPLTIAGLALWAAINGDPASAMEGFNELITRRKRLERLLGLNMMAWLFPEETPTALDAAVELAEQTKEPTLRARLITKLLSLALDEGELEKSRQLWEKAVAAAPQGTALSIQLRFVGLNRRLGPVEVSESDFRGPRPSDPLVDYPWIRNRAHRGTHRSLIEVVKSAAQDPWSITLAWGRTALDDVLAAEMQASWAGAIWLQTEVRLELAALLFAGAANNPDQFAHATALWVSSGGQDIGRVVEWIEPRYDRSSADAVLRELSPLHADTHSARRFEETALFLWDLVSDGLAGSLLDQVPPDSADNPFAENRRRLWSALALRVPIAWAERFFRLPPEAKRALSADLPSDVVFRLPASVAMEVKQILEPRDAIDMPQASGIAAYAAASQATQDLTGTDQLRHLPADQIARILPEFASLVGQETCVRVARELGRSLDRERAQAKEGTRSISGDPPAFALVRALLSLTSPPRELVRPLIATASDIHASADLRLDAWQALHQLSLRRQLPEEYEKWLEPALLSGAPSFLGDVPEALLQVLKESVLASLRMRKRTVPAHLKAARNPDPRVRQVALESTGRILAGRRGTLLESTVLSGLYDPQDTVVLAALYALRRSGRPSSTLISPITARMLEMFNLYGRRVRAALVWSATALLASEHDTALSQLTERAESDRSWIVRDAAQRAPRQVLEEEF
jgi:hypothetical protein